MAIEKENTQRSSILLLDNTGSSQREFNSSQSNMSGVHKGGVTVHKGGS